MKTLLDILSRVPTGLWQALQSAWNVFGLVMKGRRLEAELAQAKLREQTARAGAHAAKNWGARTIHEKQANQAAAEARELEVETRKIQSGGQDEINRLQGLPGHEVHKEYLELARQAKERAQK